MKLTPEEIYSLAERAVVGAGDVSTDAGESTSALPAADRDSLSFRLIVERVTEVLASELSLPTFEEWRFAYQAEPERFEEALLGLWQDHLPE